MKEAVENNGNALQEDDTLLSPGCGKSPGQYYGDFDESAVLNDTFGDDDVWPELKSGYVAGAGGDGIGTETAIVRGGVQKSDFCSLG